MGDNKGWKKNVMVSINEDVMRLAKEKHLNVSEAAEEGILHKVTHAQLKDNADYPEEMAELDPVHFWIDPYGVCKKRGEEQYFINENGGVVAVSKAEYIRKYNYLAKDPQEKEPILPKNGGLVDNSDLTDINGEKVF
jgi:hypothetical protein